MKNEWNKWKNHFYEMKGDVGMSLHEKERNKKMPTPRHKVTHNPIPTSLFLPRLQHTFSCRQLDVKMLCCLLCLMQTNKQHVKAKQRCRDGVMSGSSAANNRDPIVNIVFILFLNFSTAATGLQGKKFNLINQPLNTMNARADKQVIY